MTFALFSKSLPLGLAFSLSACGATSAADPASAGHPIPSAGDAHRVEVVAVDYAFEAPDTIPSGWSTFLLRNEGEEHHLVYLTLLPEGKTLDDYMIEAGGPYVDILSALQTGEIDRIGAFERLGRELPEWFPLARPMGGPGILLPGGVGRTTLHLEPGTYVLECYMKTPDGEIHAIEGMARELVVTAASTGAFSPEADLRITLSNFELEMEGMPAAGANTVAVHFTEHPEAGLGHDVHLVRLDGEHDLEEVVAWLDWFTVGGLRNPAPADFLGGTQEMPAGYTAYFTVDLEPGRYAWVSEATASRGVLEEFTVAP